MKTNRRVVIACLGLIVALGLGGCGEGKHADSDHDHDHDHGAEKDHGHHVHVAPHGGTLVELGEHQFNLELVGDPKTGALSAYVLDAHAENFVRVAIPSIEIVIEGREGPRAVVLSAVADTRTGETIGDTSRFEGRDDAVKDPAGFSGSVKELELRGGRFAGVRFRVGKGGSAVISDR